MQNIESPTNSSLRPYPFLIIIGYNSRIKPIVYFFYNYSLHAFTKCYNMFYKTISIQLFTYIRFDIAVPYLIKFSIFLIFSYSYS